MRIRPSWVTRSSGQAIETTNAVEQHPAADPQQALRASRKPSAGGRRQDLCAVRDGTLNDAALSGMVPGSPVSLESRSNA